MNQNEEDEHCRIEYTNSYGFFLIVFTLFLSPNVFFFFQSLFLHLSLFPVTTTVTERILHQPLSLSHAANGYRILSYFSHFLYVFGKEFKKKKKNKS